MAELDIVETLMQGNMVVTSSLKRMDLRPVRFHRLWSRGSFGEYSPTKAEWQSGQVEQIGGAIGNLIKQGVTMRIHALTERGIPRAVISVTKLSELMYLERQREGDPLINAEIVGVNNIDIGKKRTLPVLRLAGVDQPNASLYGFTVPDLAQALQTEHAQLVLSAKIPDEL